jgi:dTDP-4-dehydrorhamnose reductase
MRVVVLGTGFLGSALVRSLKEVAEVFSATLNPKEPDATRIDARDSSQLLAFIEAISPDVVISTIAISSYFRCEVNKDLCFAVNYELNNNIADICDTIGAKMAFVSSAYIFDGRAGNYSEGDVAFGVSNYARSKLLAEARVLRTTNSIVFRLDCLYGYDPVPARVRVGTNTFASKMNVAFPGIVRSPIFLDDAARIITYLIGSNQHGVFHLGGEQKLPWLRFLKDLAGIEGVEANIAIDCPESWLLSPPTDTSLNIDKILSLGCAPREYEETLRVLRTQAAAN